MKTHTCVMPKRRLFLLALTSLFSLLIGAGAAMASTSIIHWKCDEFGSGCDNAIPENGTVGAMQPSVITVPATVADCVSTYAGIFDLNVALQLTHTYRGDLEVSLTHESSATTVALFTDVGGSANDVNVTLDDEASTDITAGACGGAGACVGTFKPEAPATLTTFDGLNPAGNWRLDITDDLSSDSGALVSWSLILSLADVDLDGVADCYDACPGVSNHINSDSDSLPDCYDACPTDSSKTSPGTCGCGLPDTDTNFNGIADCLFNEELRDLIRRAKLTAKRISTGDKALGSDLKSLGKAIKNYVAATAGISAVPGANLTVLTSKAVGAVNKVARRTSSTLAKDKSKARKALDALLNALT